MDRLPRNIPYHKPDLTDAEVDAVVKVVKGGWLTTGPVSRQFEEAFAREVGAKYAVALNSCTAALHLSLGAIGLRSGQCIITTTMTFAATAEVAYYLNAEPVFVDIEPGTMNMDPDLIESAISNAKRKGLQPAAIVPVHFAGLPCNMDAIMDIAKEHKLHVIEDAAHAFPCEYRQRRIGSIGDLTCFSFYATKTITTGEGGMVTTDNKSHADTIRKMSLHGISRDAWKRYSSEGSWYYEIEAPGYKYNMTDVAASLGIVQLGRASSMRDRRECIASRYTEEFRKLEQIETPPSGIDCLHSWHLYVIRLNLDKLVIDRARFIEELKARGIGASVHFIPIHMHPYYRNKYGYLPQDFPVASREFDRTVSLPIYSSMSDDDIAYVIESVSSICLHFKK